jgi:predicted metal-binding protein
MTIDDVTGKLIINPRAREWCRMPYPGHPHGCPNYGKVDRCPPMAPLVQDLFDLSRPHWFAVVQFDLEAHRLKMMEKHPTWSRRQLDCCLYWQQSIRKVLQKEVNAFINFKPLIYTLTPEAMGINVIQTARNIGYPIRLRPERTVYKIALIGSKVSECREGAK